MQLLNRPRQPLHAVSLLSHCFKQHQSLRQTSTRTTKKPPIHLIQPALITMSTTLHVRRVSSQERCDRCSIRMRPFTLGVCDENHWFCKQVRLLEHLLYHGVEDKANKSQCVLQLAREVYAGSNIPCPACHEVEVNQNAAQPDAHPPTRTRVWLRRATIYLPIVATSAITAYMLANPVIEMNTLIESSVATTTTYSIRGLADLNNLLLNQFGCPNAPGFCWP